jgi:hypothetical protein
VNSIRYHPLPETAADEPWGLLGNGGCFVSIACLLVLHSSLYLYTLSTLSRLHCHSTKVLHHPSIHYSVLFSWLLAGISISSQPALLRLLLGVRLSAPRHSLRLHLISWYRRLVLEPLLVARRLHSGPFCISSLFTTHSCNT